jgi:hypothetical protein
MSEIIFVLTATVLVFALFLLVFFIKDRSVSDEGPRPKCARCDCQRSQEQREHFRGHRKPV